MHFNNKHVLVYEFIKINPDVDSSAIQEALNMKQPTLAPYLRELSAAGAITGSKRKPRNHFVMYWAANPEFDTAIFGLVPADAITKFTLEHQHSGVKKTATGYIHISRDQRCRPSDAAQGRMRSTYGTSSLEYLG